MIKLAVDLTSAESLTEGSGAEVRNKPGGRKRDTRAKDRGGEKTGGQRNLFSFVGSGKRL